MDAKLCPRAEKRILIGYTDTGYALLDPATGKISSSCDVRFTETPAPKPSTEPENENNDHHTRHTEVESSNIINENAPANVTEILQPNNAELHIESNEPTPDHAYAAYSATIRRPMLEECVPKSYSEVTGNPYEDDWRKAIAMELTAMKELDVFRIIKKETGMKTIDSMWRFTIKYDDQGEPFAKARILARGFSDRNSYQIFETYSPVVNQWLIRWALSIANRRKMHITKYDVSTAFLNADISHSAFLAVPEGLPAKKEEILQLQKSLYGLKPSSKNWYDTINEIIISIGFQKSKADRCLYFQRTPEKKIAILLIYVDDMLLVTDDDTITQKTTTALEKKFRITTQHDPNFFVGLEIRRVKEKNQIYLSQSKYIKRVLERFEMLDSHPQTTPMESNLRLSRPEKGRDDREYRAMIGALLYIARGTRPDIAYAVNALSRLQNCSTETEKNYVRRIFWYLKGTLHYELPIHSTGEKLEAYIDASYAPDVSEISTELDMNLGKSVSGYILRIFGDPILWAVKKQTIVASSSTAAEIVAVHDALDDIRVAYFVMKEIFYVQEPVIVWEDNISTARIIMGGEQKRNRSTLIKCYDILQAVSDQELIVRQVTSANQLADFLTKPLAKDKFQCNTSKIFFPSAD